MKHTQLLSVLLLAAMSLFLGSCINISSNKQDSEEETNNDQTELEDNLSNDEDQTIEIENLDDVAESITDALSGLQNGEKKEAVDFRELKKLLPEKLLGMKRTNIEGERSGMAGFNFSQAQAEYEDGDKSMEISIVDGAGFAGIMTGMAAWSLMEVDRESSDGYERTTTIDGYKAYEKYDNSRKQGQISMIVEDRFIVNIEADEIGPKDMRKALDKLNLKALKRTI